MIDTRAGLWLLIVTALGAVGGMLGQSLGSDGTQAQAANVFFTAAGATSVLLPIVGVLLVTGEWSQRTGLFTFALVPARARIVVAKFIAALIVAVIAAALCLLLGLLGGSLFGTGTEISAAEIGRGFLFLGISVSIGVALGLLLQSSPLAIVTLFAGPILIGAVGAISDSINDVTTWLDQSGLTTLVDMGETTEWGKVAVTALVWVALPLALGMVRLERGDID
jgi:ABC-type transport system involved in multi-copper enzyme maturation permease subunit